MPQFTSILRTMAVSAFFACATFVTASTAQDFQQIELNEAQITKFIAAQADLAKVGPGEAAPEAVSDTAEAAAPVIDAKMQAELDAIAAKHGFKDYAELDEVAANIALVLAGIDDDTGNYADPRKQLEAELAEVKGDDKLAADEKAEMIKEIEEAISATPELKFAGNIELVKKHREAIEKSLE